MTQIRPSGPSSPDSHGKSKNGVSPPSVKEETIRSLKVGDYFGEQALLLSLHHHQLFDHEDSHGGVGPTRTANVISEDCECLVLDQASFFSLLGDLNEIR